MPLPDRHNRGRSSQVVEEDPAMLKLASQKRWVFYTKGDDVPFIMEYNNTLWPPSYTLQSKLSMAKNEKMLVRSSEGTYSMSLVCICDHQRTLDKAAQVREKVMTADTSLTDISLNETLVETSDLPSGKENCSPDYQPSKLKRTNSVAIGTDASESKRPHVLLGSEQSNRQDFAAVRKAISTPVNSSSDIFVPTPIDKFSVCLGENSESRDNSQRTVCKCEEKVKELSSTFLRSMEALAKNSENSMKNLLKNNRRHHNELLELYRSWNVSKGVVQEFTCSKDKGEPILFQGQNLLTLDASDGPSAFGRLLAPILFGDGDQCMLIHKRLGIKVARRDSRNACPPELEALFKEVVERNFPDQKEAAVVQANRGANQFGAEMRGGRGRATRSWSKGQSPNTSQSF